MSLALRQLRCLLLVIAASLGLSAADGTGTGLLATYYANETLSGPPAVSRTDAQVNFAWSGGAPASGMPVDSFSARWEGEIEARFTENLTLIARTDDGVRLWLDGQLVIDQWVLRSAADSSYTFAAEAGRKYRIRLEYYEHFGSAVAQLLWQSASIPRAAIPTAYLYPSPAMEPPFGTGTGLLARYYANETLSGSPVLIRNDARVDFGWGGGSPDGSVPVESFSARWDGEIEARVNEPLTLIARTDDGVRVWLNGQVVIDQWVLRSAADSTCTFSAEAGQRYRIRMEYYEHTGAAVARLWWQSANEPKAPIPTSQLYPTDPVDPPNGTGTGLLASYFANETLSGTPVLSRTEARVDHSWGSSSPGAGVPVDVFSARWLGEIEPRISEPLTIIARTDDGVRLWLDGQLVIDQWILRGAADSTYTFSAEAGRRYSIRMEYFEHLGSAVAKLWWQSASEPKAPIPTSQLYPTEPAVPPAGTGTGLFATYFANETLSGDPILSRVEARIDHSWGSGSPGSPVPVDVFSARWEGEIEPRVSEPLTIIARTDDGVRVWLNDVPVIDAWILRGAADSTYTFTAVAGQRYRIRMEYFEHYGSAVAKLWWQSANEPKGPIPTSQLYPITGTPTTPTIAFTSAGTTAAETAGNTAVAVTLSGPAPTDVTVTIQSAGSGATAPASVTILGGGTTASVPVTISDDPRFGPDRQVTLSLVNPVGADLGLVTSHVLTIQNTDAAPTIAFTAPTSFNLEQSGTASVIVRLSAVSAQTTTVTVGISGSASAGLDYQAPSTTLQIPADTVEGTIFIPLLADSIPEQNETIILTLSAPVGATLSSPAVHTITLSDGNLSPVIANGPTPAANPVTGNSVNLSFVATDDGGAANLTFTWSTVGSVPAPVSFAPATGSVGTTSATAATFTVPGSYPIQIQVRDAYDMTATAQTVITVQSTPALVTVAPATATVSVLGTQAFTAAGVDQFGTALAQPLPVVWSVSSGGSIATNGLFTAGTSAGGPFMVFATLPTAQGNAAVTVIDQAPTLVQGPTATVDAPATGLVLTALGADDGGEAALSYQWSVEGTAPGTAQFAANGSNAAKSTTATLSAVGTYVLRLTATDGANQSVSATTNVTVAPALAALAITPATAAIGTGATQDFTISGTDQFNAAVPNPTATWMVSGGGTIATTANGARFTAGSEAGGPHTVTATSGTQQATAEVTILSAPVISQQPQPQSVLTGETATFSVTAVGAAPLTYVWQVSADAGTTWQAVVGDGTGASYQTPTLSLADNGSHFRVTVNNAAGSATSHVAVLSVAKRTQTITFAALPSKLVSDAPFTLTGISSSGLVVSYTSSDPTVASITGTTVTIHAIGTTTITADQVGDDLWQAADPVPQVFTVTPVPKQPQTITFASLPTKTVGDAPFTLTASASSGLSVSYTSSDTAVATVSGSTVTILGAGTTTITAAQPGDDSYDAALSIDQPLTVVGRPAPVVSYVKSTLAKATFLGTYPTDIGITGIDVTIIDPASVISFSGDVKGGVFQVEVDNATPAVAQVTVALAFRFGADLGPQAQRTVPFGASGGGGGDYEDGSPNGIPPFPPTVTLVIESGLTGKQVETINDKELHFTQNEQVTVRVHTSGSYSPISSIIVTSSDGQSVPAENGVVTFPTPTEGAWELSATAIATNDWGTAAGSTEESTHLIVDRTEPRLLHVLPSRYWPPGVTQPADAPPPAVPLHHGVGDERLLVRLNGNDTGTNTTLRDEQWLNVFDHAGYTGEAQVDDLSGLRTDVTQSGEAKDRQGFPTDITITVRPPADAERGDPQTVLLEGFSGLADSVEYNVINETNRRGLHRLAVTLEDRAGNRLEAHDEYDLWVQTKAPEAKFAIRMGASGYAMEADETQLSPARFIFTSADIEEGWQDSRDDANRLQLLGKSETGPRLWLLKTPTAVPPDSSVSVNVILRDRAGGISEPVSVTVSRQVLHEDLGQSFSEGPMAWFAQETYYDFETPLFRDAGPSPTDEFMWSIPDNDRLPVALGPHRGNVEGKFTMTKSGEIPYDPDFPEYGGMSVYKVTAVTVAGNKGYVEHTHLNVSPLDVGDGAQRRFAPAVITIPPTWKQNPPNVPIRIRDQGIVPVRQLGQLEGTITLAGIKTPSQSDGTFDLTQGPDTNSITAEIDLRRTINDPDAGPVAPGQPIPQIPGAQPGFNAVEYVVSASESSSGEYVQSTPYTGNAAYRWMNLIRLSPDVVATGTATTIRIEAGFLTDEVGLSNFQANSGDYVNFYAGGTNITENRSDYETHKNDPVRPKNKISIVGQRLKAVGRTDAPHSSVQALELDLLIGSEVSATLADVDVKFGAVKAYTDDLSAAYSNEESGAHRLEGALAVVQLDYIVPDDEGSPTASKIISVSNPVPQVILDQPLYDYANIDGNEVTLSISGHVIDPYADNSTGPGDIQKVTISTEQGTIKEIPIQRVGGQSSTFFKQHPYKAFFNSGTINVTCPRGSRLNLKVETSPNALGLTGKSYTTIWTDWRDIPGLEPISGSAATAQIKYTFQRVSGNLVRITREVGSDLDQAELSSAGNQDEYSGLLSGSSITLQIEQETVGAVRASLFYVPDNGARLHHKVSFAPMVGSPEIYEGLYTVAIPAGSPAGTRLRQRVLEDIFIHPPSVRGAFQPFTFRVKFPQGTTFSQTAKAHINNHEQPLALKDDGFYYPEGPSRRMFAVYMRNGKYYIACFDAESNHVEFEQDLPEYAIDNGKLNFRGLELKVEVDKRNGKVIGHILKGALQVDMQPYVKNTNMKLTLDLDDYTNPGNTNRTNQKFYNTCWWMRTVVPSIARIVPSSDYEFPGSYPEDIQFLDFLRNKKDQGRLAEVPTTGIISSAEVFDEAIQITSKPGTLNDMEDAVGVMTEKLYNEAINRIPLFPGFDGVTGVKIYNALPGQIVKVVDFQELLWYLKRKSLIESLCSTMKVPRECVLAGILTESEEDLNKLGIWGVNAEFPVFNNPAVGTAIEALYGADAPPGGRVTGSGLANLNYILPREAQTGIYVEDVLVRRYGPLHPILGDWHSSTDRDFFLDEIQMKPEKSLAIYVALWRATAEALCAGNPDRFDPSHLTDVTASKWAGPRLDIQGAKWTFATAVFASIEQASVGFDKSGIYIANKIDLRTAIVGGATFKDDLEQLNTAGSYLLCSNSFPAAIEKAKWLLAIVDSLSAP